MQLEEAFTEAEEFTDDIMDRISKLLTKKKIKFSSTCNYEIVVSGKTKADIKKVIEKDDSFDPQIIKVLLSITESNGNTYIRQKYN